MTPSGSCVHQVRFNFDAIEQTDEVKQVRAKTFELVEFLHDILKVGCVSVGGISASGRVCTTIATRFAVFVSPACPSCARAVLSKPMDLLGKVKGIEFVHLARPDECCGFGGTFSVFEEGVSAKMGHDKVRDQHRAGAEYIVSSDSSCMMHQQGCAERIGVPHKVSSTSPRS